MKHLAQHFGDLLSRLKLAAADPIGLSRTLPDKGYTAMKAKSRAQLPIKALPKICIRYSVGKAVSTGDVVSAGRGAPRLARRYKGASYGLVRSVRNVMRTNLALFQQPDG